jgi:hypothetical protein
VGKRLDCHFPRLTLAIKVAAANRWVAAVNADGKFGKWEYAIAKKPTDDPGIIGKYC